MKVRNMRSERSNRAVANQYVIVDGTNTTFQSYDATICCIHHASAFMTLTNYWNYSITTSKYFYQFMDENLLSYRPSKKDVMRWLSLGFIPAEENYLRTDIRIYKDDREEA